MIRKIGEELHSQYVLTYTPTKAVLEEGSWHEIRVELRRYRVKVRVRDGYWRAADVR